MFIYITKQMFKIFQSYHDPISNHLILSQLSLPLNLLRTPKMRKIKKILPS